MRLDSEKPRQNDLFKHGVLELLLAEYLPRLLASSHKVRHDLLGRAEHNILEYLEAFVLQLGRHLVRKAAQLAEKHSRG